MGVLCSLSESKGISMSWKKLFLVPLLALTPVLVGCGSADCEELCEKANDKCGEEEKQNCDKSCDQLENLAEKSGCEDEYDDLLSCMDDADDICDENKCSSETTKYGTCVGKYCVANPTNAACQFE